MYYLSDDLPCDFSNFKVLVLFERSGCVSVPFREAGFNVTTVDLFPHLIDNSHHIIFDLSGDLSILDNLINFKSFDLLIAFPPCTYFSKAGLHFLRRVNVYG